MYSQINKRDMFVSMFALMIVGGLLYHGIRLMTPAEQVVQTVFYR